MEEEREQKHTHLRIYALSAFLLASLVAFAAVLFQTQVVKGEYYREQSVRTITRKETVEASRGILTDRNGQMLVTNRPSYTLTFDASSLDKEEDANAAILRLLQLCESQNVEWTDTLPVSQTAPYTYTVDQTTSVLRDRFLTFLQSDEGKNPWVSEDLTGEELTDSYLTGGGLPAPALLDKLRDYFQVDPAYSDADARKVLGVRYELAVRQLVHTNAYVLADDISTEFIALLTDGDYRGAKVGSSFVREYRTDYAAHILGFEDSIWREEYEELQDQGYQLDDRIGREGAEKAFESYLRGTDGTRVVTTNTDGKITSELYSKEPQPGDTVVLTIDIDFQQAVEEALAETVSAMNNKDGLYTRGAGAAVVQVGTGDVLALASYPTFNLSTYREDYNTLSKDPGNPLFNRATSGTYAPGSTLKPMTAIAALQEGKVTLTEKIRDTGRWYYPGASTHDYANCWKLSGHGLLNVTQAITVSCNFFFAEMGYRLGLERLNAYASAFGLGEHTGIEIGDYAGRLAAGKATENLAPWAAFGQADYAFTPLQLANYIATLVSGGQRYAAHLLKTVKSYDNSQVLYSEDAESPLNTINLSEANLEAVMEGMHALTTTGSVSPYFRKCVVSAGAKTGTAQLGGNIANNGVFVCFAPFEDPQIAVAIVIEKGGSGSALASTAVEILNAYFTADEVGTAILGEGQLLP